MIQPSVPMRSLVCVLLALSAIALAPISSRAAAPASGWGLFAMDNGVGRGQWSPERQASTLAELGFDGISYNYTRAEDIPEWRAQLEARGLALTGVYLPARLEGDRLLPPDLPQVVENLRGSGAVIWLTLPAPARPGDHEAVALTRIREVADIAAKAGVRVVLYPHRGFYLATAEHALSLAMKAQRSNVGLTVNLSHELAAGNGRRLPDIIRTVAPLLERVSLNGASDVSNGGWGDYIKLLGAGSYDVAALLRVLREVNYAGPVGVQFYNLAGDPKDNLAATIAAWKALLADVATTAERRP